MYNMHLIYSSNVLLGVQPRSHHLPVHYSFAISSSSMITLALIRQQRLSREVSAWLGLKTARFYKTAPMVEARTGWRYLNRKSFNDSGPSDGPCKAQFLASSERLFNLLWPLFEREIGGLANCGSLCVRRASGGEDTVAFTKQLPERTCIVLLRE